MSTTAVDYLNAALSGRYHLKRELGQGGMATVYLADDLKHRREVAIKVLKPELAAAVGAGRFLAEVKTTANLNHPHIVPLFDSGEADSFVFYVMPYVSGESLKERLKSERRLSAKDATRIAAQVAAALDFAHSRGVIHRDIKPANILLQEGVAMVADFGIALAVTAAGGERITETGLTLGTPHYMSPEQATGEEEIDGRADTYSLGCVVYEMLAGEPPFSGRSTPAIIARHIMDPVPELSAVRADVGSTLVKAITRALAKNPADRFASSTAFVEALDAPAGTSKDTASVAVLPLANLSGDPQQEYFSDGMTEALITDLAKVGALKVISRTSVMRYKGSNKPLPDIARELGVNAILEGSVLSVGDEVRITVQLIDAATDTHMWAESYDRQLTSILSLQGEVARTVAEQVEVKLTPREKAQLDNREDVNPTAHRAYLKGRFLWNQRGAGLEKSIPFFEAAIQHDPSYAPAYAGLADAYALIGFYGIQPLATVVDRARAAAEKALELTPNLAEAHASLGYIQMVFDWDWPGSGVELRRALELNPSYDAARIWYAVWLCASGKAEQAVTLLQEGLEYDPLSVSIRLHLAVGLCIVERYDEMVECAQEALELAPDYSMVRGLLGLAYHFLSRHQECIRELEQAADESGREQWILGMLGSAYAAAGKNSEARTVVAELEERRKDEHVSAIHISAVYGALGEKEHALHWFKEAYEERAPLMMLRQDTSYPGWTLASLIGEPSFEELIRRLDDQTPHQ